MESIDSSETLVLARITRHHFPEEDILLNRISVLHYTYFISPVHVHIIKIVPQTLISDRTEGRLLVQTTYGMECNYNPLKIT
jgi:hypothetical protein